MKERIAILGGIRTPYCKADGVFKGLEADDLGAIAAREIMTRTGLLGKQIDEVIFGNVAQPVHAVNIARVIALRGCRRSRRRPTRSWPAKRKLFWLAAQNQ